MSLKFLRKTLIGIFIIIILIGIVLVIVNVKNPKFDAITYISGLSAFSLSILTILYVYNTSVQLNVLNKQLEEMKMERELQYQQLEEMKIERESQHQPLPWIREVNMDVECPRFFYDPHAQEHSIQCRYFCDVTIKNIGMYPSIYNDISARIIISKSEDDTIILKTVSKRLDTLEEKQIFPSSEKDGKIHFTFPDDKDGKLLETLINSNHKNPILQMRILFKNTLGGCFVLNNSYSLSIPDEKDSIFKTCLSTIKTFPIMHSQELDELIKLRKDKNEKWYELFNKFKEELACSIEYGIEEYKLVVIPIPSAFNLKSISTEEYSKIATKISYGMPIALLKGTQNDCRNK